MVSPLRLSSDELRAIIHGLHALPVSASLTPEQGSEYLELLARLVELQQRLALPGCWVLETGEPVKRPARPVTSELRSW